MQTDKFNHVSYFAIILDFSLQNYLKNVFDHNKNTVNSY